LIDSYVYLTRDLRTVDPKKTVKALQALLPERRIAVVSPAELKKWEYAKVIMPEDEISRDLAEKYFKAPDSGKGDASKSDTDVKFVPVFLRWNRHIALAEHPIPANRKITRDGFAREMIGKAIIEADKSEDWWRKVATIIVKDANIVFSSHNHHLPSRFHLDTFGDPRSNFDSGQHQEIFTSIHSEATAIAQAASKGLSLKGAHAYVTTFPCPNCARLLGVAGIKKVYYSKGYSLLDAEKILEHFGIEIVLVQ
jgi:dCMP deaminase